MKWLPRRGLSVPSYLRGQLRHHGLHTPPLNRKVDGCRPRFINTSSLPQRVEPVGFSPRLLDFYSPNLSLFGDSHVWEGIQYQGTATNEPKVVMPQTGAFEEMAKSQAQNGSKDDIKLLQRMLGIIPPTGLKPGMAEPIFVCIDCEAFEHAQSKVTEVGVAILDSRDVSKLKPGVDRDAWLAAIKYAHYRPVEYAHLCNKTFIHGCPGSFNFGTTTWIKIADAGSLLRRIFSSPTSLGDAASLNTSLAKENRNIVFVGHGASNDDAYLRKLGFSLTADADIVRTMDTQRLATSKKHPVSLYRLALSLGMDPVNLHNAGNDAAYTLQAVVLMALKEHAGPGGVVKDLIKFVGKLPPMKHNSVLAPHIWAGTAKQSDLTKAGASSRTAWRSNSDANLSRRKRKQITRASAINQKSIANASQSEAPSSVKAHVKAKTYGPTNKQRQAGT